MPVRQTSRFPIVFIYCKDNPNFDNPPIEIGPPSRQAAQTFSWLKVLLDVGADDSDMIGCSCEIGRSPPKRRIGHSSQARSSRPVCLTYPGLGTAASKGSFFP